MVNNENDALQESIKLAVRAWKHRDLKNPFTNKPFQPLRIPLVKNRYLLMDNTIPASIEDVINVNFKNEELKPLITKREYTPEERKHFFVINLPAGITFRKFCDLWEAFRDATDCTVVIERNGRGAKMTVYEDSLRHRYPFSMEWIDKHKDKYLPIPIGYTIQGLLVIDLIEIPHILVAGVTRYGKSNFIHVVCNSLLLSRQNVVIAVIDKKRLDYGYLRQAGVIVVSRDEEIASFINSVMREIERRMDKMEGKAVKIQNYQGGDIPYLVLVIDELSQIRGKENQQKLIDIVRLGAGLGIHVVCALQRPSHTAFDKTAFTDFRSQMNGRVVYHLGGDSNESQIALDSSKGADIRAIRGRCLWKFDNELQEVQTMFLPINSIERDRAKLGKDFPTAEEIASHINRTEKRVEWYECKQSPKMLPPR